MIYYLLYPYSDRIGFLNVLRYVPFRVLAATMTAMLLTFGLYPWFIRRLQSRQIGQVVRKEGPQSHLSKAGTPTMGGALILLALVASTVLWADPTNTPVWLTLAVTAAYGVVGYIDDARKVRKKDTGGLSARGKLVLQFSVAIAVCAYLWYGEAGLGEDWLAIRNRLAVPFVAFDRVQIALPSWAYVMFGAFVIVATSNCVNLTDGLDGLAIGPVMINAGTYAILAYLAGVTFFGEDLADYLQIPSLESASDLSVYCGAMIGAGFGFLWFNTYPAQVFMGDVGSLALGGGLGTLAVLTKNELLSVLLGGIFVIEGVSVIGQVASFKLFKKRIFLMAPIHHHFEKKGWPEPKVIVRFWIISIMLALASLATLKLR
ncbi:phospho-N-acetylmuramoyl-pentapeptide-transferase [Sandaracinus amylolyticus]|uniref:phospho-N-acetylmuramoyl-pentapeptide- transferase n=1 Tax=Sandaracinus amylolyticus TaxID=927083 RepID=UPI001EFF6CAB|nr:phospho-N-acetylmuramoyl-pentapeptide-transferase [Sandaracinus amylolyticus]UJR80110.1 Phospho-n-acetylmuramoyl-pentapeptide-transferas e [Sandaracinus amylolyticus]